jgi:RHS repeat-associated protein
MKARQFAIRAGLLLVFLGSALGAHAWYDPSMQRWINRDPIREQGFELARATKNVSQGTSVVNLHTFQGNDPVGRIDALGLWCFPQNYIACLCHVLLPTSLKGCTLTCTCYMPGMGLASKVWTGWGSCPLFLLPQPIIIIVPLI